MEQITEIMTSNPQYGYLLGAGVFLFIIIGLILDWDWVVEPGGGYFNIAYFINAFGRKTVRIVYGLIMLIGIIICLFGYFTYNPELYN
ncbi:immunity 17 family protein [Lacinutrix sp. 5H-3-7-4]|uniref:immunity 17 family protein n=1 Tax=Lacinutrix sp. (strain 5H-3-7-4) TaxID=983544 RepID=UPI00020A3905|nr:immunity 17 family protein [Lacinutrix sp. 5H-3-7-4]AEH02099.1 hypothetical protein Lacal_2256 [Lacinutrix sp. 5H-3-7-4]